MDTVTFMLIAAIVLMLVIGYVGVRDQKKK